MVPFIGWSATGGKLEKKVPYIYKANEALVKAVKAAKVAPYVTENLAGFYVRSTTLIKNGTYTRTIQSLANTGNKSLFDLMKVFETEAKARRVNKVVINGIDIVEMRLINESGARLLGYTFKQISKNSIQLTKILK